MSKPIHDYVIRHPSNSNGDEDKYYLTITLNQPFKKANQIESHLQELLDLNGIDGFSEAGRYSFRIGIARTFDPIEVKTEIEAIVKKMVTGIIVPGVEQYYK